MKLNLKNKIYLITDEKLIKRNTFIEKIKEAAKNGIKILQIREKKSDLYDRIELVKEAVKIAHKFKIKIFINDDPYLAKISKADGVHIGKDDFSVKQAKEILKNSLVGVSCYGDVKKALEAEKDGADYVSFGNFYLSPTKPKEKIISLDILKEAKEKIKIPIVAIGGISEDNYLKLLESGADSIAVISAILSKNKIKEGIKNFNLKEKI